MSAVVLYRGPFQGRRLRFLLDAIARVHGEVRLAWLNPGFDRADPKPWVQALTTERNYLVGADEMDGSWGAFPRTARDLRRHWSGGDAVYAIGFTSLPFGWVVRPRRFVWGVNGIPEERLLYNAGATTRAAVAAQWAAARIGPRPDAVVVVSEPMGRLVARRIPGVQWLEAPTCVDEETFTAPHEGVRSWLTYVGSGAPWQGIDLLAPVWRAIADLDPTARFRVVSRDERARDLLRALSPASAEMVAGATPGDVARMLWQSEVGFLVRRRGVVNETSFPTKFGEYVAAGVPVVTTDIGWEVSDIVRRTGCGVIVGVETDPAQVAREILDFRQRCRTGDTMREACRRATAMLARDRWIDELAGGLRRVMHR